MNKQIAVLGGGQLARMLSLAGSPLGVSVIGIDPTVGVCAGQVTQVLQGEFTDSTMVDELAKNAQAVTIETENIPLDAAKYVASKYNFCPSLTALEVSQDRLLEKNFFQQLNINTPKFADITSLEDLQTAVMEIGLPSVLKTRRGGYDGKGQFVLKDIHDIETAWQELQGNPLILEEFIEFDGEVSIISVRNASGEIAHYPLTKNTHVDGILRLSIAPYAAPELAAQAEAYANAILEKFNYVGVLAIEFFYKDQKLIANEMAPRVHNSGHWTLNGSHTSQFENHLRALLDLPLGKTEAYGYCAMINCIGDVPELAKVSAIPFAHMHDYGKEPRAKRKVGHINVCVTEHAEYAATIQRVQELV